jgi:hypothetical protein
MLPHKTKARLLAVLRLGGSDQIHEADTALSKAIQMMEEHGITIDALLDQVTAHDLPQSVCADLARRYCLSRPDMGATARDEYYRVIFLRIAERYAPRTHAETRTKASTESKPKPTEETPQPSSKEQGGGKASGSGSTDAGSRARARSDWKSRMDEARERAREDTARKAHEEATHEKPTPSPPRWYPSGGNMGQSFFTALFRNPIRTIRLFFVCFLFALPWGFVSCILLAGILRHFAIHTLDGVRWIDALSVALFPFMVAKGYSLVRQGWLEE